MKVVALSILALVECASAFVSNAPPSNAHRVWGSGIRGDQVIISGNTRLYERKPYITGNWKLNPSTRDEAVDLAKGIADSVTSDSPCDVALFVPFPFIEAAQQAAGDKLSVGAEVRRKVTFDSQRKYQVCSLFCLDGNSRTERSIHWWHFSSYVEEYWRRVGSCWSFGT